MDYEYDPDFRWLVVDPSHGPQGKFRDHDDAEAYAKRGLNMSVVDTKPKSRIPESARYIMWGDITEPWFAAFVEFDENEDRVWALANSRGDLYDDEGLIVDVICDQPITVLKET